MYRGKIHSYTTKICYRDLDMYSVLYHPRYFELADCARNQAFEDFGYPIEEQLLEKVGFTVAGIENVSFKRPLFMGEEITIFTEVVDVSKKSCKVAHWICLGSGSSVDSDKSKAIFLATYCLVFVSLSGIEEYPLNGTNITGMRAVEFHEKVKLRLGF